MTQVVRCIQNVETPDTSPQALFVLRLRHEMGGFNGESDTSVSQTAF